MLFDKQKSKFRVVKLYSIGRDQDEIDRPKLVESILRLFEKNFNEFPENYDIHGAYGIAKGSSVQLKTFLKKLDNKGHEKYYALSGDTVGKLGFKVLFGAKYKNIDYSELLIWYPKEIETVSLKTIVKNLIEAFSLSTAYEITLNENIDILTENKIKKSLFGNNNLEITYNHMKWISYFKEGGYRAIYENNMFSGKQLENAKKEVKDLKIEPIKNLYHVATKSTIEQ